MPFIAVASRGGPYEDTAYAAGWEMGALDAQLRYAKPPLLEMTIHRHNAQQADLVAMNNGYTAEVSHYDDSWVFLRLTAGSTP